VGGRPSVAAWVALAVLWAAYFVFVGFLVPDRDRIGFDPEAPGDGASVDVDRVRRVLLPAVGSLALIPFVVAFADGSNASVRLWWALFAMIFPTLALIAAYAIAAVWFWLRYLRGLVPHGDWSLRDSLVVTALWLLAAIALPVVTFVLSRFTDTRLAAAIALLSAYGLAMLGGYLAARWTEAMAGWTLRWKGRRDRRLLS
jgi:hypothetical protein